MDTNKCEKCGKIQSGSEAWDYDKGGTDQDLDNNDVWDYGEGGTDRDLDSDGVWHFDKG